MTTPGRSAAADADPAWLSALGHRNAMTSMRRNADSLGAAARQGPGWFAVRTRASDNSSNGVVVGPGAEFDDEQIERLATWVGESGRAASWLLERPDPTLAARLIAAGGSPERTGNWCGRALPLDRRRMRSSVRVERVADAEQAHHWLRLASECDWFARDLDRRAQADALRHPAPYERYWIAVVDGVPAGFATTVAGSSSDAVAGTVDGEAIVDLRDVGVGVHARHDGVGTALVSHVLDSAAADGARWVIAEPSPDGWALMATLGFTLAPVTPDLTFYFSPA